MYAIVPEPNPVDENIINELGEGNDKRAILKLAGLDAIEKVESKDATAASFMVGTTEFAVPLHDNINVAEEIEKLEKELHYTQGFLASVEKKLSNERFVANAPEAVVTAERKKQADAQSKIATLQETLAALKG